MFHLDASTGASLIRAAGTEASKKKKWNVCFSEATVKISKKTLEEKNLAQIFIFDLPHKREHFLNPHGFMSRIHLVKSPQEASHLNLNHLLPLHPL